ncbi:hypothetical protein LTS12_007074 [Elasticomyces elasticus]|nr:hypothetical protein LTS12_007074 [Elasticomyces elasticus]
MLDRCTECYSLKRLPSPEQTGATLKDFEQVHAWAGRGCHPGHTIEIDFKGVPVSVDTRSLMLASKPVAELIYSHIAELPSKVSRDGFQVLVSWLSNGTIRTDTDEAREAKDQDDDEDEQMEGEDDDEDDEDQDEEEDEDEAFDQWCHVHDLCEAYKTGESLDVSADFLDAVMDRLVDVVLEKPNNRTEDDVLRLAGTLSEAFEPGSPGRLFTVEWLFHDKLEVDGSDPSWDFTLADSVNSSQANCFRNEFLLAVFRGKQAGDLLPWEVEGKSRYHASRDGTIHFPSIIRKRARSSDSGLSDHWDM